ncbi:MAG: cell division protein ZapE [Chloroherpetonaceae bacterium]|nr:cell division protein ZapE [Chloroherpetonaceae bacterium]MDW8437337.1 cell division protein ZapE [Chloroherpetonaceae bacterium]
MNASDNAIFSLAELRADISFERLRAHLVPPPRFEQATLENYVVDANYPSQAQAKIELQAYIDALNESRDGWRAIFGAFSKRPTATGLYLDGAFGVGKTHLLASIFHAVQTPKKLYLSFTELMYFIGLLGLEKCAREMSDYRLICIDEFELDDPGNTTMSLGFLSRAMESGVAIATTSNAPPLRLGEGRFDVKNFQREIGDIAKRFRTIRIDGKDYREKVAKTNAPDGSRWRVKNLKKAFEEFPATTARKKLYLRESDLFAMLRQFHPMRYFELAENLSAIFIEGVGQIHDQYDALRFVYLIDKLYDDETQIFVSARIELERLFPEAFYQSAYAKKYWRCVSRLKEMCAGD